MDKNSVIGLLLIGAILVGFSYFNSPTEQEKKEYQAKVDSIEQVESKRRETPKARVEELSEQNQGEIKVESESDSAYKANLVSTYGRFANSVGKKNELVTIENDKLKATISTQGGRIASVELKEYKTSGGEKLFLFDEDSSRFTMNFYENNKYLTTDELYFEPQSSSVEVTSDKNSLSMRLQTDDKSGYIEYNYTLAKGAYQLDYQVNFVGLDDLVRENANDFGLTWNINALTKEKNIETERSTTTVFYKYLDEDVDYLSETSDDNENLEAKFKWVSFKQQYFSAAIISEEGFSKDNSSIAVETVENSNKYTRYLELNFTLPFARGASSSEVMTFYFGPNHYQTLAEMDIEMEEMINLGWPVIRHVSKWLIIPLFNFLDGFNISYGIIILILTIVIKLILFPLTYKNYKSSAKMKVLKPEIEELNKKHEKDDPMKKQQATMALYKKAGVNPMAGCVPMLLQMPILYAMFRFFPASIELRQEAFLWADDLSSYDSILDFGFEIPFYGDHVSLFTLLMAASTFFYTRTNSSMTTMSGPQASQMQVMMYMMPFMLLFFFNSYAAGLSYYYFLANVITMGQQFVIKKWFIDEQAILQQIEENKKKPVKKSNFQKRLEEMAKQRGYQAPKR